MKFNDLIEAGRTHRVPAHSITPRKEPEEEPGYAEYRDPNEQAKRENKFFATGDHERFHDTFMIHVIGARSADLPDYEGINVIFQHDRTVTASTADKVARYQWRMYRDKIIKAAEDEGGMDLERFFRGKGRDGGSNGM